VKGADFDPTARVQHRNSHQFDRHQRCQPDAIGPGSPVQQPVIVDFGEEKHGCQAAGDPEELF